MLHNSNTFSWFSRPAHMRCLSAPLQNRQHPLSLSFPSLTAMRRGDERRVSAKIESFPFILLLRLRRRCCPFLLFQLRHNCPFSVSSVESCTQNSPSLSLTHYSVTRQFQKDRQNSQSRSWDLTKSKKIIPKNMSLSCVNPF